MMPFNPFSVLTSKIFAGLSLVLLIAVVVLGLQLRHANNVIEKQRNSIAECNAARTVQNAMIAKQGEEAKRTREAFEAAVKNGQKEIAEAEGKVQIIYKSAKANGCPTPKAVMEAGL